MQHKHLHKIAAVASLLALPAALVVFAAGASATPAAAGAAAAALTTTSSLGNAPPTFAGPAATGCNSPGCSLLSGPTVTSATTSLSSAAGTQSPKAASNFTKAAELFAGATASQGKWASTALPLRPHGTHAAAAAAAAPVVPSVSCQPMGPGCDSIDLSSAGALGVKGLNAVDSASMPTNFNGDIEPPDQGLCANSHFVVETNNIGEILIFRTGLQRASGVIPLDTVMGLTAKGWSSGGDPSCLYDPGNGGHWFFTQIASASTEASGGPFSGCFAAVANTCYEAIAVTQGSNPFGPYNVYYQNANYNPSEPGNPYQLNDFAKIAVSRDAFLMFYDEFPLRGNGLGGGGFNGAQEFAFSKTAMEQGQPVLMNGSPNPSFNVAIENMGLLPTPDGTCAGTGGATCWYQVIAAMPPDASQFDNNQGGSAFMLAPLDFVGSGDNRIAAFDWTGLKNLNTGNCGGCAGINFGGQLFSGVLPYYNAGQLAPQKAGPIPLGNMCKKAGLTASNSTPAKCPESGLATNGDGFTQASQAHGQVWGAISTEINQTYTSQSAPELHQGAAYYVVGTSSFDSGGPLTLTSQSYVSPKHEDLTMPAMAAEGTASQDGGNGRALITFTLSGNGGPTSADGGGFFPSTAYGRLTASSGGLLGSTINIADLGQSPQDGFSEYQGFPGPTRPRWGDYSAAIFLPNSGGRIYFATEYIQYPNCTGNGFTLAIGTCGGTRDGFANWGTSVNSVVP